jgi:hypothetical protein
MEPVTRSPNTLPVVRQEVRRLLTESPAFRGLSGAQRNELAHNMVKVANYIVSGADGRTIPASVTLAGNDQKPPDPAGDTAGQRFAESGAVAAQQGVDALGDVVEKVNFPGFVAGLIDGVFNAIVTSSIKQMEAYAELVKNVSKSVDQYMKDNVSDNNARDYLAERYPDHLEVDISGERPRLKAREGFDENNMPNFQADLGIKESPPGLDDEAVEQTLVPAARRRIAMDRQQLLATMVMMGINRLVVTNGSIEASVMFELSTRDEVKRKFTRTSDYDRNQSYKSEWGSEGSRSKSSSGFLGLGDNVKENASWYSKGSYDDTSNFKVSTARSEDSTARVDLHAKLGGKVNVQFKSDYFPMEKMVDVFSINKIQQNSSVARNQAAAPATPDQPAPSGGSR